VQIVWSLANWCLNISPSLERSLAHRVLKVLIESSKSENEKMMSNGLRGLGYFVKQADFSQARGGFDDPALVDSIVLVFQESLSHPNSKILWNACVHLGNLVKSDSEVIRERIFGNQTILRALLGILEARTNFKAIIHCTQTLCLFSKQEHFSDLFVEFFAVMSKS